MTRCKHPHRWAAIAIIAAPPLSLVLWALITFGAVSIWTAL